MSLARSLTSRMRDRFEQASQHSPNRAFSTRTRPEKTFDRKLISLPVELISCSNVLAYEAPDIGKITANMTYESGSDLSQPTSPVMEDVVSPMSSASSTKSWEDPLASPALTSASSVTSHEDSRECSPANLDPNPMSSFFLDKEPAQKTFLRDTKQSSVLRQSTATTATASTTATANTAATSDSHIIPELPKRSLTHTKQTHQVLAHKRSLSRLSDTRRSADSSGRTSFDLHHAALKSELEHPFGAELEKVNELVEELATASSKSEPEVHVVDEETQYLIDNGFSCFTASDYMSEIMPLFSKAFGESTLPSIQEWI